MRCRQTAEIVAAHLAGKPDIVELDALTPGSDFEACLQWTEWQKKGASVAWVGHAADVSHLTAALVGDGDASIRFAKGAVAAIGLHGELGVGCGELHWWRRRSRWGCEGGKANAKWGMWSWGREWPQ